MLVQNILANAFLSRSVLLWGAGWVGEIFAALGVSGEAGPNLLLLLVFLPDRQLLMQCLHNLVGSLGCAGKAECNALNRPSAFAFDYIDCELVHLFSRL